MSPQLYDGEASNVPPSALIATAHLVRTLSGGAKQGEKIEWRGRSVEEIRAEAKAREKRQRASK